MGGLYNLMDDAMAQELGVDVKTYIEVIDKKCTEEEATFIINTIMDEDEVNIEKAKASIENLRFQDIPAHLKNQLIYR
jgi:hypothetical protein